MEKKWLTDYSNDEIGKLAILIVSGCIRNNTSLDELHSELKGFTDKKMKKLMIECCDNVYIALAQLLRMDVGEVREKYLDVFEPKWNKPKVPMWFKKLKKLLLEENKRAEKKIFRFDW